MGAPLVTLSEAKGLVPIPGCIRMNKYENSGFLNSQATAPSIKDTARSQPAASRPTGQATKPRFKVSRPRPAPSLCKGLASKPVLVHRTGGVQRGEAPLPGARGCPPHLVLSPLPGDRRLHISAGKGGTMNKDTQEKDVQLTEERVREIVGEELDKWRRLALRRGLTPENTPSPGVVDSSVE